mmetsp:Transcript_49760/g.105979  ORF Transcript_49760/g.105979 Transcript_49760/m.105979 type:complete len:269 (+) Transcript_49760:1048-1854(+)
MTIKCVELATVMCPRRGMGGLAVKTCVQMPLPSEVGLKNQRSFITPPTQVDLHPPKRTRCFLSSNTVLEGFQRGRGESPTRAALLHFDLVKLKVQVSPNIVTFGLNFFASSRTAGAPSSCSSSSSSLVGASSRSSTSSSSTARSARALKAFSSSSPSPLASSVVLQPFPRHFQMKPLPPKAMIFSSPLGQTKLCNSGDFRQGGCEMNSNCFRAKAPSKRSAAPRIHRGAIGTGPECSPFLKEVGLRALDNVVHCTYVDRNNQQTRSTD